MRALLGPLAQQVEPAVQHYHGAKGCPWAKGYCTLEHDKAAFACKDFPRAGALLRPYTWKCEGPRGAMTGISANYEEAWEDCRRHAEEVARTVLGDEATRELLGRL